VDLFVRLLSLGCEHPQIVQFWAAKPESRREESEAWSFMASLSKTTPSVPTVPE
jgi:hypothetical protein